MKSSGNSPQADRKNGVETRTIVKITAAAFFLFLCVSYWPDLAGFLRRAFSAAAPLALGAAAAYLLNILMSFYQRHLFSAVRRKTARAARTPLCLVLALATLVAIIALVASLIIPQLVSCASLLAARIPPAMESFAAFLEESGLISPELVSDLAGIDWQARLEQLATAVFSGIGSLMNTVITAATSVVSGVVSAVVAVIFAIYLLTGKERLGAQCQKVMKRLIPPKTYAGITHVLSVANECFHRFIVGQCMEAVILGTLCALGMMLLGLPYGPMIGAVISFTALIPIVGAFIGGGVGVFLIMTESPTQALIFLIYLIILQQLEGNLIYPKVVGSSIGLPAIWVFAAVTVGGGVFGIFGMMMGVPLAATAYRLLREYINRTPVPAGEDALPKEDAGTAPDGENSPGAEPPCQENAGRS